MAGLGGAALGSSPFGVGTPVPGTPNPKQPTSYSRYINPGSGDYGVDPATGQLEQMPPVRQRMLIVMKTILGSSSVLPRLGIDVPRKIDKTIVNAMRNSIREAYRQLTDVEKVVRLDTVLVSTQSLGRLAVVIGFTDLTQPSVNQAPIEQVF